MKKLFDHSFWKKKRWPLLAEDMLFYFPIEYKNYNKVLICDLFDGITAHVAGIIKEIRVKFKPKKYLMIRIQDETGFLWLKWFNFYSYQFKKFQLEEKICIYGVVKFGKYGKEITHPQLFIKSSNEYEREKDGLFPVYKKLKGIDQETLHAHIRTSIEQINLSERVPNSFLKQFDLISFETAIRFLHNPCIYDKNFFSELYMASIRRIKFDELLAYQLALEQKRCIRLNQKAISINPKNKNYIKTLLGMVPFNLTKSQEHCIHEIINDMQHNYPMCRLLQGDVGTGKTVVALIAALYVINEDNQVALMVPTEILAEQHYQTFSKLAHHIGIYSACLKSGLKPSIKQQMLKSISNGNIKFVIGTQALIQSNVSFKKLGLVIIDEQHRFGVDQFSKLIKKGGGYVPHQLMMSATPIPRTLAMSILADIDISTIVDEIFDRKAILTKVFTINRKNNVLDHVEKVLISGKKIYWICPVVNYDSISLQTVINTFDILSKRFPRSKIAFIHSNLPNSEKINIMDSFSNGDTQILIGTSLLEVGVDVKNAVLMIIENAERFGLAQLHQFRGRIGRGKMSDATCILLYKNPLSNEAKERLRAILKINDGFEIAKLDLRQRGPGEFFGKRQSGSNLLLFSKFPDDEKIALQAREVAKQLINQADIVQEYSTRWKNFRLH